VQSVGHEDDLRDLFRDLVDAAPHHSDLSLTPEDRRRRTPRPVLAIAAAVIAVIAVAVAALTLARTATHPNSRRPTAPATQPLGPTQASSGPRPLTSSATSYWFGPKTLPGYSLTTLSMSLDNQQAAYQQPGGTTVASLTGFVPTATQRATVAALPAVRVGSVTGHIGTVSARTGLEISPSEPIVAWPVTAGRWVALSASSGQHPLARATLIALANKTVLVSDDHVAVATLSYLPTQLRFTYTATYLNQDVMLSPDGTVGSGYRTLSFTDRGFSRNAHSTLDIVSVIEPTVNLATATVDDLPTFDNGPWRKTTVRGHLAWVAPHDVLIEWGPVQIGVASTRTTGDSSTPLLSQDELLKIAAGLTVADSNAVDHGFPLARAVPATALR
jgi:hypothetical protein